MNQIIQDNNKIVNHYNSLNNEEMQTIFGKYKNDKYVLVHLKNIGIEVRP